MAESEATNVGSVKEGDDKVIAALSHALLIFLPVIAPLVIWVVYKDKSKYVKAQSMQALVYQLVGCILLFVWFMFATVLTVILIGLLLYPVGLVLMAAFAVYGLYAAYKCYEGEDFKYAVIGDFVAKKC